MHGRDTAKPTTMPALHRLRRDLEPSSSAAVGAGGQRHYYLRATIGGAFFGSHFFVGFVGLGRENVRHCCGRRRVKGAVCWGDFFLGDAGRAPDVVPF